MATYPLYSTHPGAKNLFASLDYPASKPLKDYQQAQCEFWDAYTSKIWGA